jgi:hypothetical protein
MRCRLVPDLSRTRKLEIYGVPNNKMGGQYSGTFAGVLATSCDEFYWVILRPLDHMDFA